MTLEPERREMERWCTVTVAVERTGVSVARLRRLEREGLIRPQAQGSERRYSEADLRRIRKIRRLTEHLGVTLAAVEIILRLTDEVEALQRALEEARGRGSV